MHKFCFTPNHLVANWSCDDVQLWMLSTNIGNLRCHFYETNGKQLLQLNKSNAFLKCGGDGIPEQSLRDEFELKLFNLQLVQSKYQKSMQQFQKKCTLFFETADMLITQSDQYIWSLYLCDQMSQQIIDIYKNLIDNVPTKNVDQFQHKLSLKMRMIIPIVTKHLKQSSFDFRKRQHLLFVTNVTRYRNVISAKCWLETRFFHELIHKLQHCINHESDYLKYLRILFSLTSLVVYAVFDEELKMVFKQLHVSHMMKRYISKHYKHMNHIQLSFAIRNILFIDGAKNSKTCEWVIHNTSALDAILIEYENGLKGKCMDDIFNYIPDPWDRAISISLLCDNVKFHKPLLDKNIFWYLHQSLMFEHNTHVENQRLYEYCCSALYKLSIDPFHHKYFFEYCLNADNYNDIGDGEDDDERVCNHNNDENHKRFMAHKTKHMDLWRRLHVIECNYPKSAVFIGQIDSNIRGNYMQMLKSCLKTQDVLIATIVACLW